MAKEKVITVMCAARLPEMLVARIDSAAASGGVSRAQFIAQACRRFLDEKQGGSSHATPQRVDAVQQVVRRPQDGNEEQGNVQTVPQGRKEVDMQALRDICAGKTLPSHEDIDFTMQQRIAEIPICGKTWWEDGNHYECLMDKGHKEMKHGLKGMVRVID